MKQSKFSLADVLTFLTAFVFGYVCFLGINFSTLGDTSQSIIEAVIFSLTLALTALAAKLLKQTSCNFKISFAAEVLMIVLFTGFIINFTWIPFAHFFNVSKNKTEIQNKLQTSIAQAENMFNSYENYVENRKMDYEGALSSAVNSKDIRPGEYEDFGFTEGVSDNVQIQNKMFTTHHELFPSYYSDTIAKNGIKEVAIDWLRKATKTTNQWKSIGIIDVVNEVEGNSKKWLDQLIELSKKRQIGETESTQVFEYELTFDDVKTHFTNREKPTPLSIGLATGAYFLMLFSWFITKRNTKILGSLRRANYEIEL